MCKKLRAYFIFVVLLLCLNLSSCRAEEEAENRKSSLKSIDILTGFGKAHLRVRGGYEFIPVIAGFNFDLKPFFEKFNLSPAGLAEFQLEPFISLVYQPRLNIEAGNAFMLKFGLLPETSKFQPYINAGAGVLYMSQHTNEQAKQFNFLEQGGVGMYYFFRDDLALNMNCRIRHISNAGLDTPNQGINTLLYLVGVTWKF